MEKTVNQKAWFLVLPVLVLVSFSAIIPLMTVVNYSGAGQFRAEFFWAGLVVRGPADLGADAQRARRQALFTGIILVIQVPLGIFVALNMPKGFLGPPCAWC